MKHYTPSFTRRNVKAHVAALLSYLLLAGQMAPLVLAAKSTPPRTASPADVARESAGVTPRLEAAAAPAPLAAPAAFAPTITATKVDTYAGQPAPAAPGSTITYAVTINNAGPDPATNLTLTDTVDPNTTIVPGSAVATPIAADETFNVLANVRIAPNAAGGLLANDNNPNTGGNTGLTASGPTSSTQGGNVTVSGDGSFTYNPPAGFTGSDSFTYTITSANGSDTAVATFNVGNGTGTAAGANDPVIWFVQSGAAGGGDGRLTSPFNCLVGPGCFDPVAADQAGDTIFLYEGTGPYNNTGALTLLNTQKLVGQGATDTLAVITGVTVPPHSDALPQTEEENNALNAPTITSTANGVNLAQNNVLRGFNVGNVPAASIKINGAGFGQLTVGKTSEPDVSTSGTGRALFLQNGTLAATSGVGTLASTSSSGAAAVLLTQITAGALTATATSVAGAAANGVEVNGSSADIGFGNTDVAAGTNGVVLANNPAGTRSFGTLSITGGTGVGFQHLDPDGGGAGVGGGAVSVTGAMTVTNPAGVGIDVDSSNANLSFAATTVNKGTTGNIGVDLTNNATRTIGFTSLTVTTTSAFALNTNNSGTVNAGGGSLTQNGAGGGAASLTNTALGLSFTTVSSTSGGNGILFNVASGTFASGTTNLQSNAGVGLQMLSSSVAANFGNTTVNSSAGDAVDISGQTANVTFADLDLTPDANLRGLDVGNSSGTITSTSGDIATTNAAAVNIDGPAGRTPLALVFNNVDVTGGAGPDNGVNLTDVSGSFTVNDPGTATAISNTTGTGIVVNNSTAAVNFGTTSVTGTGNANADDIGTGIFLTNNGGAVTFNALTLTPDAGERALYATDTDAASAAGQITISSGTVTVTNDTAVEIVGASAAARTPISIQFTEIDASGGTNGIVVQNASDGGNGFRVLGSGTTDGSGGTIANITNRGASFINADDIALSNMTFTNVGTANGADPTVASSTCGDLGPASGGNTGCNAGVHLDTVTGAAFTNLDMNGGNQVGINGNSVTNFTLTNSNVLNFGNQVREDGLKFRNMLGTSSVTGTTISGNEAVQVHVENISGTLTSLSITNSTISTSAAPNGSHGILFDTHASATGKLVVQGVAFSNLFSNCIDALSESATGGMDIVVNGDPTGASLRNSFNGCGASGITIAQNGPAPVRFNIFNNGTLASPTFLGGTSSHAININQAGGATASGVMQGAITGNFIGGAGATSSTVGGDGITAATVSPGTLTVNVSNNRVRGTGANGIRVQMREESATSQRLNATLLNNDVLVTNDPNGFDGMHVVAGTLAGDAGTMCAEINNNDSGTIAAGNDFVVRQRFNTTFQLRGYTGASNSNAAVQTHLDVNQANDPVGAGLDWFITNNVGSGGGGFVNTPGGAPCTQPTLPSGPVEFVTGLAPDSGNGAPASGGVVVAPSSSQDTNVTSRPFVSPMRLVKTQAAQPVVQQRAASVRTAALQTKGNTAKGEATRPASTVQTGRDMPARKDTTRKPAGGSGIDTPIFNPPVINGDTLTWNIGTLPANSSVTITFQVTIDNPFTGGSPQVSNQGTVSADGISNVLTDDPSEAGANNPTVTPVLVLNIRARDGQAPEPPTGTAPLLFTITLSSPAISTVMVNYATADGGATPATGGASCAGNVDYVTTTGTATFAVGEQVRTVSVDICSDGPAEPDETFLLNLTGTNTGTLLDNQAVGTITPVAPAGTTLISELRTFGPGGSNDPADDFVEIYNNTDSPVTVAASDSSAGWGVYTAATCNSAPLLLGTIPNGTVIPARGHFLLTGAAYSLANYGGTGAAAGDLTMAADLPNNASVAVFSTSDVVNLSTVARLDAVGFGANTGGAVCDLLREGATAPAVVNNLTMLGQYSVLRDPCGKGGNPNTFGLCPTTGNPKDSNVNASDFFMVDPNGIDAGAGQRIGAAGPENIGSPVRSDSTIGVALIDSSTAAPAPPNRVRDFTSDPGNNSTFGTLSIRRRFTNNTGSPVTRLRFRIVDISTLASNNADLRARTSSNITVSGINDPVTCTSTGTPTTAPCQITVQGTTLEQPPTQPNGGGFNSTLTATLGTPLANGNSINVQFLLGIQQTGSFKFYFIIEALP